MKQFTTIKVGYTAGIYGCSNEVFTTITVTNDGIYPLHFYGMYGSESRIAAALKEKGYEEKYTSSRYGRMTRKDITRNFVSEKEVLEEITRL